MQGFANAATTAHTLACNRRWPVEGCNYDRPAYSGFGPKHNAKYRTDGSRWIDDAALQRTRLLPPSTRRQISLRWCQVVSSRERSNLRPGQNAGTPLPLPPACKRQPGAAPHRQSTATQPRTRAGHSNTSGTNATASRACANSAGSELPGCGQSTECGAVGRRVIANSVCTTELRRSVTSSGLLRGAWRHDAGDYVRKSDALPARRTFKRLCRCRCCDPGLLLLPWAPLSHRDSSAGTWLTWLPLASGGVQSSQPARSHLSSSAPASRTFAVRQRAEHTERSQSALRSLPQNDVSSCGRQSGCWQQCPFACTTGSDTEDCRILGRCGTSCTAPVSGALVVGCWTRDTDPDSRWTLAQ
jgi:hypothetical protein